jgi:ribosomal protein L30E
MIIDPEIQNAVEIGFFVIGVASAISPVIPNPQYNKVLIVAKNILDLVAFNFGHAKNANKAKL